jgi:hypothetical protein
MNVVPFSRKNVGASVPCVHSLGCSRPRPVPSAAGGQSGPMCARARGRSHPRLPRASPAGRGRRCCRPLDPPRASALPAEKPARLGLLRGGNRWRPRLRERPPTGRGRPTDRDVIEVVPRQDGIPLKLLDWGSRLSITASAARVPVLALRSDPPPDPTRAAPGLVRWIHRIRRPPPRDRPPG